ncbi:hypothetical protein MMC09_001259 [Bachmanniomyces sp. S44760]|nr:hypothetical protein [Bachmanniomyces sp. S44760]
MLYISSAAIAAGLMIGVHGQSSSLSVSTSACSTILTPTNSIQPTVASGYRMALVATGLTAPRSIEFDSEGNLLVVQQGAGIVNLELQDAGGTCVTVKSKRNVVTNSTLNHGLQLSPDGKTLYASSAEAAYSWSYDPSTGSAGDTSTTLVSGMNTNDHTTRTLLLSQKVPGMLLISRGSTSNIDPEAESLASGHSQIRAFNLANVTSSGYQYDTDGLRLGWGLRNSVGVAEHPLTGGIYSVENSVDEIERDGINIHQNNPGEELNYLTFPHGYLNGTAYAPQGGNHGYPFCFAAWLVNDIPNNTNLSVGSPFAMGDQNSTINDTYCASTNAPRLTFQAHMAPLDILFNGTDGTEGWVTFHGSWDRTEPSGYKVGMIPFSNGEPVAAANNNTATIDVFINADNSKCPDHCFRPAGLAFDSQGRLFVSSDASGEIYIIVRDQASNGTAPSTPAAKKSGARRQPSAVSSIAWVVTALALCLLY